MKSSKVDPRKKTGDNSSKGNLLHDIETISNALYLDKPRSKKSIPNLNYRSQSVRNSYPNESTSNPKENNDEKSLQKEKKSIWSWKGLMGFTRNRRFNCCFSLQVHSIEGLPPSFENLEICVHFKRRDEGLVTSFSRVLNGVAEFEGLLTLTCSVYGSRSGAHHSAKYEAKHFLLYASINDAPEVDLGKHRVDLTRFLPLTLEELENEKSSSRWTTSFNLMGMAKGAIMNVSFGYSVVGNNATPPKRDASHFSRVSNIKRNNSDESEIKGMIRRGGSLPARSSTSSRSLEDIKDLHEVFPNSSSELAKSVDIIYRKLEEEKLDFKVDAKFEPDEAKSNFIDTEIMKCEVEKIELSSLEEEVEATEEEIKLEEVYLISDVLEPSDGNNTESVEDENDKIELLFLEQERESTKKEVYLNSDVLEPSDGNNNTESVEDENEKIELLFLEQEGESTKKEVNLNSEMENFIFPKIDSAIEDIASDQCTTESLMKDLELALQNVSVSEIGTDSPGGNSEKSENDNCAKSKSDYKMKRRAKSLCLDDVTNSVADEFLNKLGIEHSPFGMSSESEPESPRERLLKQFEKDTLASGCPLFDFNMEDEDYFDEEFELFQNGLNLATELEINKPSASTLEDLETEDLMRKWGINERAFVGSPPGGSPVVVCLEEASGLSPLGEGVGPFVRTKNGGFLRSMNMSNFIDAKNGGNLVMQVSSPVVVPAEMGSGIMKILERLASVGIEKLSMQANKLMPLDDVTGKTMRQVAWEAVPGLEASERQDPLNNNYEVEHSVASLQNRGESSEFKKEIDSEYVSLEDLAPLAMDKIEALSIEGLRIQSGMSNEEAPSNITPQTFGEISALQGKRENLGGSLGLDGAGGLQLLNIEKSDENVDVDNLMSLSLTLDEWLRIDSGEIDDEDGMSERTCKILAAHHASDLIRERAKTEKKRGKKCGLLGDNFTVALLVQLRDPVRNFEPVGTPMLALIQVERVFVPPKPKFYSTVSAIRAEEEEEIKKENTKKEDINIIEEIKEEEKVTQFKISEVHMAGLRTEPGKKKIWGSPAQQLAGSRWLVANGMGKKAAAAKSKIGGKFGMPAKVTAQQGDTLWSISARFHGNGGKWKELAKLNPHIRNPDVILPNQIIKLR